MYRFLSLILSASLLSFGPVSHKIPQALTGAAALSASDIIFMEEPTPSADAALSASDTVLMEEPAPPADGVTVTAPSALLMEASTGTVVYEIGRASCRERVYEAV